MCEKVQSVPEGPGTPGPLLTVAVDLKASWSPFIEQLTVDQAPCCKYILSFNLFNKTKRRVSSFPFCRQGNWGSESLNYMPQSSTVTRYENFNGSPAC